MRFLRELLDDAEAADCGRCDNCTGERRSIQTDDTALEAARLHIYRPGVSLNPRQQWPTGMKQLGVDVAGKIAAEERPEPGRAIARFTDLGYGRGPPSPRRARTSQTRRSRPTWSMPRSGCSLRGRASGRSDRSSWSRSARGAVRAWSRASRKRSPTAGRSPVPRRRHARRRVADERLEQCLSASCDRGRLHGTDRGL